MILFTGTFNGSLFSFFLSFVCCLLFSASDVANAQKHKNLNSEDVFQALDMLEFDQFIPSLREHLLGMSSGAIAILFYSILI